jgi:endogenous inhibitor of DNA gyrase (YacG/DUF329 family)
MTIKVTTYESKMTITKTVCTCDICGKTVDHFNYSASENGKPYECSNCYMIRINEEATEKNKNVLGALVTNFKIDWGEMIEITLKCTDGSEHVLNISQIESGEE